jgi:hypothetical protein
MDSHIQVLSCPSRFLRIRLFLRALRVFCFSWDFFAERDFSPNMPARRSSLRVSVPRPLAAAFLCPRVCDSSVREDAEWTSVTANRSWEAAADRPAVPAARRGQGNKGSRRCSDAALPSLLLISEDKLRLALVTE